MHPAAKDETFAEKIESDKGVLGKRTYFYAKVGEVYSQIGRRDWVIEAFTLARKAIDRLVVLPDSAELGEARSNLATAMVIAERYLEERPGSLDQAVFSTAPNKLIPNLQTLRDEANLQLPFGEEFKELLNTKKISDMAARNSYVKKVMDNYDRRLNESERVRGMTFVLSRTHELNIDPADHINRYLRAVYQLKDAKAAPGQLARPLTVLRSASRGVEKALKQRFAEAATEILPSILHHRDPESSVTAYAALAELWLDLDSHKIADELLLKAEKLRNESKGVGQDVQSRMAQILVRAYVQRGDYKRAKDLADASGRACQLEGAIQLLAAEAEKSSHRTDRFPWSDALRKAFRGELP